MVYVQYKLIGKTKQPQRNKTINLTFDLFTTSEQYGIGVPKVVVVYVIYLGRCETKMSTYALIFIH